MGSWEYIIIVRSRCKFQRRKISLVFRHDLFVFSLDSDIKEMKPFKDFNHCFDRENMHLFNQMIISRNPRNRLQINFSAGLASLRCLDQ